MNLGRARLDLSGGLLEDGRGEVIPLRAQSMKVLQALARRAGEVVTKDELFAAVWGDVHVTDDSLTQCVGEIRRAIGDEAHRVVQTVPKRGYRLVPAASAVVEAAGPAAPPARSRSPWWRVASGASLALAVLGLAASALWPAQMEAELPSIAVLPFEDLAGEARWERLGRGFAAEIGADLSRSRGVVVIPAETVEAVAGGPGTLAEALGARFVLDGTLQADGEELRVTARLTDAERGRVVWSDRWARPTEDLFGVQDEIVERISGSLDGTWTGALAQAVRTGAAEQPTRSLEAYELYLRGAEAKHEFTPAAFIQSAAYLRRALDLDPEFVQALVTLSIVVMYQADYASDADAITLIEESFRLAERAVALDPDDPNALIRLACSRLLQDRRVEAWPLAARAVEMAPTNPDVLATAAWCYFFADRGRAPLDWAEKAIALNPGHPDWYSVPLALTALFSGDLDLARRAGREAPPMPDVLLTLGAVEALSGNVVEARNLFESFKANTRYRSLSPFYFLEDMSRDAAWAPWVEAARLVGFPVTDAEADALAGR